MENDKEREEKRSARRGEVGQEGEVQKTVIMVPVQRGRREKRKGCRKGRGEKGKREIGGVLGLRIGL